MSRARLEAETGPALDALASRLLAHAERRAVALAETRKAAAHDTDAPWRRADLLWPQFTKG